MKSKLLILGLALVLIAAACNKTSNTSSTTGSSDTAVSQNQTPTPSPSESPTPSPVETPSPTATPDSVTINMTSSGFSPANITIKAGTKVVFINNDNKGHWPASNPHPVHTDLSGFDALAAVDPGNFYAFTFTKVGTWGYHDHLAPSVGGKITVTQ